MEDLLAAKGAELIIPPFLNGRSHLTLREVRQSKLISRARIHVERFNRSLKQFKFLAGIIPQTHVPLLSQAVFVASMLVNFAPPLAK